MSKFSPPISQTMPVDAFMTARLNRLDGHSRRLGLNNEPNSAKRFWDRYSADPVMVAKRIARVSAAMEIRVSVPLDEVLKVYDPFQ